MKSKSTAVLAISAFCLSAQAAFAGIHNYRIEQITQAKEACVSNEELVTNRFAQLTNSKILSHGCEQNPGRSYDMVIEYARPSAPNFVTTYSEFASVHGLFKTAEDCAARRNSDVETFRNATGLEPIVAYCFQDYHNEDHDTSWTLRMDAFGSPKMSPYNHSRYIYSSTHADTNEVEASIKSALAAHGAIGANTLVTTGRDRTTIMISYYAVKELSIVEYEQGHFASLTQCENNRPLLNDIYSRAGGHSVAFFCAESSFSDFIRAFALGIVTQPLASELTSMSYQTFESCESKRTETEEAWRVGLERNIIGSICAIENTIIGRDVKMRIFWLD